MTNLYKLKPLKYKHKKIDYLSVSELSKKKISELILNYVSSNKDNIIGIKLGVLNKGCGGSSYNIEYGYYDVNITDKDEVLELDDMTRIFVEPERSFMFFGMLMDYEDNGLEYGFRFVNPNEKGRCGCGTSFFVS